MASTAAVKAFPELDAGSAALAEAEETAQRLDDEELRLFGAWLARYASERLERPVVFSFRPLTEADVAFGRKLADGLNVDESDAWTEDDRRDLTSSSLGYAATVYPEDEDLIG